MTDVPETFEKVAIIDDSDGEWLRMHVEDMDATPVAVDAPLADIGETIDRITELEVDGVICDHRIKEGGFAEFYGAELAAQLYREQKPTVLVTKFSQDMDTRIREFRRYIPVVVDKGSMNFNVIKSALELTRFELQHGRLGERAEEDVVFEITDQSTENRQDVIEILIPSWNSIACPRFPLAVIPEEFRHLAVPNSVWLGQINIGAPNSDELFIFGSRPAPEEFTFENE